MTPRTRSRTRDSSREDEYLSAENNENENSSSDFQHDASDLSDDDEENNVNGRDDDDDGEDDEDDDEFEEDEDEFEEDEEVEAIFLEAAFLSRIRGGGHARVIDQLPLLADYTPPPLTNDLAVEISMRSAPHSFRCRHKSINNGTPLSPLKSLLFRETMQTRNGGNNANSAVGHIAAFHRLPTRPTKLVDRMASRAYIGRFTGNGETFIAAYQNERKIRLYDVHQDWKLKKDIHARNLRWTVTDIALSSDQNFLLYASITPVVHLVNISADSSAIHSIANVTDVHEALHFVDETRHNTGIWSLRWSPDNTEIIAGTADLSLYIFDMATQKTVVRVKGHSDDVNAVAYASEDNGNVIFTGSDDHEIKVWDRRTLGGRRGSAVGVFVGHTQGVAHLDSKGDGLYVISNSKDQSIKLWDMRKTCTPKEANAIKTNCAGRIPCFNFDYRWQNYPARGRLVQHPEDGSIASYYGHSVLNTLCRAYWSPAATTGQRYIYVASACGSVIIYDVITCQEVGKLQYHREIVRDCSWHPHLPLIATAAFDGSVVAWEPDVPGEEEAERDEEEAAEQRQLDEFGQRKPPNPQRRSAKRSAADGRLGVPGRDQLSDYW